MKKKRLIIILVFLGILAGWLLNPSGSRNLEYDEAVQPKQTNF